MDINFETSPENYKHWKIDVDHKTAYLILNVNEAPVFTDNGLSVIPDPFTHNPDFLLGLIFRKIRPWFMIRIARIRREILFHTAWVFCPISI